MYSKEESAQIRKDFWIAFDVYSRKYLGAYRKWLTYNTGIKDLVLKFDVNRENAKVLLSVENRSEDKRFDIFVKLKEYELLYEDILGSGWIWDEQFILDNDKEVCAIYKQLDNVNIYRKETWTLIFDFFAVEMLKLEEMFEEVKPFIKGIKN
ncbi:MAG: DUF4268 domain-containing protein [Bacteroidales bacterium]|jgi:hypothetical protein|nr:DUF4268 domain-containing protein [Bacteroidales bacterium]